MNVSDQIIAVLDDLCRRFGIAIDWTAGNMMPYLEELATKFVAFETETSWFWIYFILALTVICWIIFAVIVGVYHGMTEEATIILVVAIAVTLVDIAVVGVQIYDIITCDVFPEKIIVREVSELLNKAKNG